MCLCLLILSWWPASRRPHSSHHDCPGSWNHPAHPKAARSLDGETRFRRDAETHTRDACAPPGWRNFGFRLNQPAGGIQYAVVMTAITQIEADGTTARWGQGGGSGNNRRSGFGFFGGFHRQRIHRFSQRASAFSSYLVRHSHLVTLHSPLVTPLHKTLVLGSPST